eukprot:1141950-Pelagomonas_calceolata.AAC.8
MERQKKQCLYNIKSRSDGPCNAAKHVRCSSNGAAAHLLSAAFRHYVTADRTLCRWLLTSYLLPRDIPIYADVSMGVKAHNDKVWWLSGK